MVVVMIIVVEVGQMLIRRMGRIKLMMSVIKWLLHGVGRLK